MATSELVITGQHAVGAAQIQNLSMAQIQNGAITNGEQGREIRDCLLMVGDSAWEAKDWIAAKKAYELVLALDPLHTHAHNRLGRIALVAGELQEAEYQFSYAYTHGAKDAATCVNLAVAHTRQGRYEQGIYWCEAALDADETFLPAYIQLAAVHHEQGQLPEAIAAYDRALQHSPDNPELLFGVSVLQLAAGDFLSGFLNYDFRPDRVRLLAQLDEYTEWRGEDLAGKTILVCGEQGLGDQILWARYLPLLTALGAQVVYYAFPEIARLVAIAMPEIHIVTSDREVVDLDPDYWVAIGSLPARWEHFEQIGAVGTPMQGHMKLPYLWPAREDVNRFQDLLPETGNLKVGLCWRGNPKQRVEEFRRVPFADLQSLLGVSGCDFYAILPGDAESGLVNLAEYVHDVADTAAAIAHLDLVITSCTMVAHLAGAMGKRVWVLVGQPAYWAWGVSGTRTPWYDSAELIRTQEPKQWGPAVALVKRSLEMLSALHLQTSALSDSSPAFTKEGISEREHFGICKYGPMIWPRNDRWVGRSLELYGEFSESELELLRQVLKPGDTAVECGAEIGGITVGLADAVGPDGWVVAIEPQPVYFDFLSKNSTPRMQSLHMAAGAEAKRIRLQGVETRKVHAHGMRSEQPDFEIPQCPLDELNLQACALLKVDVDGMEHDILKGAEQTIDRCRPVLYVEYDKPELYPAMIPWILAKGYRIYQHFAPLYNPNNFKGNQVNVFGKIVSAMLLCVPNERKDLRFSLPRIRAERAE